jgi:hypothetical protein
MMPFPKPPRRIIPAVIIYPDGREVCTKTQAGRAEYKRRRNEAASRQNGLCGLCGEPMTPQDVTFEHVDGRGSGGGHRDDRIWIPDPKNPDRMIPHNLAAHHHCNFRKGSKRISTLSALRRIGGKNVDHDQSQEGRCS